ncbi:FMN-binding glutamate synthase family protein [Rossellomorea vietnamensis]|uniref:FMN-binding glutamate synthase family protein n=1 Tax=Rossellomorea vietnamensis TaxID=218284 RepID=A0ACD4CD83_9BACI|nr:FMN-binding glutamate synthase family protein [Rossellomorea vietnamensis]UXH46649.1 FMN-binding glutamate synthase family protein [Rossellomorea vietnamensis]
MNSISIIQWILLIIIVLALLIPAALILYLWMTDEKQKEHAVLRNFPVLGKMRYILEKIGPELRQYLFHNDNEGKPFSRLEYTNTVMAGKYKSRMLGFGSERDFEKEGYYIRNTLFPVQRDELRIDNSQKVKTKVYKLDKDNLLSRREHREETEADPFLLKDEDAQVIGQHTCRYPFTVKGLIGQSAMSYGSLGEQAITALSTGLNLASGSWMNTGEGGLSKHHLKGGVDIICQIGPGLFGVRTKDGKFSWEEFKKKSDLKEVKAFELKLAQGAKTRGGHVDGKKVTQEIANIRNVEPWKSIDSPNRFKEFSNNEQMLDFIEQLREVGGKPVGIKLVVGNTDDIESLASYMATSGKHPDFITVDGGEGGTGASYQELAASAGVPIKSALPFLHDTLVKHGVRDKVKIFASGKLLTPDKIAFALALGADFVNIARGLMFSVGCIQAQVCHTNNCPVGVATTDKKLQRALIVEEKSFRVCNYIISLREGLYNLAAAAGIDTPTKFGREHIVFRDEDGRLHPIKPEKALS